MVMSRPKILRDGTLLVEYTNGGVCIDTDNVTKNYSLDVTLHCNYDVRSSFVN